MISTLDISSLLLRISSNELSTDKRREPVERTDPAVVVAVAGSLVGELLMSECQRRHVARGHELDRHQGLPLRRAAPGPGENQLAICHHLAKLAADLVLLAARGAQHDAITSAHARIGFRQHDFVCAGTEPALQRFGAGPGAEAALRRRPELAPDGEAGPWSRGGLGVGGHGL